MTIEEISKKWKKSLKANETSEQNLKEYWATISIEEQLLDMRRWANYTHSEINFIIDFIDLKFNNELSEAYRTRNDYPETPKEEQA